MKFRSYVISLSMAAAISAVAQQRVPLASSHAPTVKNPVASTAVVRPVAAPKPAVRVNGTVLTENDVLREMYTIFPYARQHNGFPKDMEAEIRKGATEMIIFEELLFQEAKRRNLDVPAARLTTAMTTFRKQFPDQKTYDQYLRLECNGSSAAMREKIRRSLLIDRMLKTEVETKSTVTLAEAKAFYEANAKQFEHNETFSFQTISIIPPDNSTAAVKDEARRKITDAARLAKQTKDTRSFGVIAEQISEDDWRTKLGDRGMTDAATLPPSVLAALRKMKTGEVSDPIAVGTAWVVVRLNAHSPAGKSSFAEVKPALMKQLQDQKRVQIRAQLNKKLRKDAKVEVL